MTNTIPLSEVSISELTNLCQTVQRKNPKNEISVNMATGISEYIANNRIVTEKQAQWLARNLDFYKLKRPFELAEIVIGKSGNAVVSGSQASASSPPDTFQGQVIRCLSRIEKLLVDLRC